MIKKGLLVSSLLLISSSLYAGNGEAIAERFEISAAGKVSAIWERIFDKKKYKKIFPRSKRDLYLNDFKALSSADKESLKSYLIQHAADSDKPKVAGGI